MRVVRACESRPVQRNVYDMCMLSERFQLLISKEQRRRLDAEAKRRGKTVGALIREAIDTRLGNSLENQRLRAVAEMRAHRGGHFLPIDELERIVDEERDAAIQLDSGNERRA